MVSAEAKLNTNNYQVSLVYRLLKHLSAEGECPKLLRQQFLEGGGIVEESGMLVFAQDFLFRSLSAGAAFVLGASANGWSEWRDRTGNTLSEVYRDDGPIEPVAD